MGLFSTLGGIDSRPTPHLGRTCENGSDDLENEELGTRPFAHDFRDDPAWVGVIDDDFPFLGTGCGDSFGYLLDAVHFEELGEVVSDVTSQYVNSIVSMVEAIFTGHPSWPSSRLRAPQRFSPLRAREIASANGRKRKRTQAY